MLKSREPVDAAGDGAKLDDLVSRLRIAGALAEADPFDDATAPAGSACLRMSGRARIAARAATNLD